MPQMPTLGPPPKKSPAGKVAALAIAAGLIAGGVYWWRGRPAPPPPPLAEIPAAPAEPAPPPPPVDPLVQAGLERLSVRVDGPLETTIVQAVGQQVGPALTQVVSRSLVWWVQVPGDLRKGDTLDVLYEVRAGEEPAVHAVRFTSGKLEKTFQAYRFKPQGEPFARFFQASGEELEERLEDSPIDHYEQITSLLRDGRRHKGVDFKAPVGTPVKAPFAGTITRKNWNFRGNGNCLELAEAGGKGRRALFLHLAELPKSVGVGTKVQKGEAIAQSGNSGRSFAPHLHYQLMSGGEQVIDPFEAHKTFRRRVAPEQQAALDAEIRRLDGLLSGALAGK